MELVDIIVLEAMTFRCGSSSLLRGTYNGSMMELVDMSDLKSDSL